MPFVRIDLRKGKDAAFREEISRVVHGALVSVGVPKDDRFQVIAEHEPRTSSSTRTTSASIGAMNW